MASKGTQSERTAPKKGMVLPGDRAAELVAFDVSMVDFFVSAADLLGFVPEYSPHLD